MDLVKTLKGQFLNIALKTADKRIDGSEITKNLEEVLDNAVGKKQSEVIQRGAIMNLLCEMQQGLYNESMVELAKEYEKRAKTLRDIYMEVDDV